MQDMTTDIDLVIRGGRIVTPEGVVEGDLAVAGGRIVSVGPRAEGARVMEARGRIIAPGGA